MPDRRPRARCGTRGRARGSLALVVVLAVGLTACDTEDLSDAVDGADEDAREPAEESSGRQGDEERSEDTEERSEDTDEQQAAAVDDHGSVGDLGRVLLDGAVPEAVVEVDASPGVSLGDAGRSGLSGALGEHGGKSVSFAGGDELASRDEWSTEQIREAASGARDTSSSTSRATVHVLVLDGGHARGGVLGIAVDASTVALFPEEMSGGPVSDAAFGRSEIETAVSVHELGHLFGLVNVTGQGGFHEDPEHEHHSDNDESVMFWAVETDAITRVFEGAPPTTFDDADRREMAAIRGS